MPTLDSKQFRKAAKLHKALSNERRVLLLVYLSKKERAELMAVADISESLKIEYSLTSKHLQLLDNVDLIERVRHGQSIGYRVTEMGKKYLKLIESP